MIVCVQKCRKCLLNHKAKWVVVCCCPASGTRSKFKIWHNFYWVCIALHHHKVEKIIRLSCDKSRTIYNHMDPPSERVFSLPWKFYLLHPSYHCLFQLSATTDPFAISIVSTFQNVMLGIIQHVAFSDRFLFT